MKGPIEIEQSTSSWLTLTFFHDNIKLILKNNLQTLMMCL
jgi:hypothetical protein